MGTQCAAWKTHPCGAALKIEPMFYDKLLTVPNPKSALVQYEYICQFIDSITIRHKISTTVSSNGPPGMYLPSAVNSYGEQLRFLTLLTRKRPEHSITLIINISNHVTAGVLFGRSCVCQFDGIYRINKLRSIDDISYPRWPYAAPVAVLEASFSGCDAHWVAECIVSRFGRACNNICN